MNLEIDIKPKHVLRKSLTLKFIKKSDDHMENILRLLLFELLPIYFLEGFEDLKKLQVNNLGQNHSKFIFTSNNFNTDEIFKIWTATKIQSGTKYYIGQHGNNYGTRKYISPTIEEKNT